MFTQWPGTVMDVDLKRWIYNIVYFYTLPLHASIEKNEMKIKKTAFCHPLDLSFRSFVHHQCPGAGQTGG